MQATSMKQLIRDYISLDRGVALLTWGLVSAACLFFLSQRTATPITSLHWLSAATGFCVFMLGFHCATREQPYQREPLTRIAWMALQYSAILVIFLLVPYNFAAILMVLWAAQLPYFMPLNRAIAASPLVVLPHFLVYQFYWQDSYAWLSSALFWTFTIFSIVMMGTQLREAWARQREQAVNRELRATQALLAEASKQSERTRIARNIHDLLGHHLTALTINLQVAERLSSGEPQELIAKSRSISQLLLADVRQAVAELRDNADIDIAEALAALAVDIPGKDIQIDCQQTLNIQSVDIADAIIFSVQEALTNFLKHSTGDTFVARIQSDPSQLTVTIKDNGYINRQLQYGNGLTGLQERVAAAGGTVTIDGHAGLSIAISFEQEPLT